MEQQFNYKPKSGFMSMFWGIVVPIFLIVLPLVYPFSITPGGFTILPYPWTIVLFIAVGLLLLWSFVSKMRKESKLKGVDCTIRVAGDKVLYKDIHKGEVRDCTIELAGVISVKTDEDGEITVRMNDGSTHEFDKDYFENEGEYKRFVEALTTFDPEK